MCVCICVCTPIYADLVRTLTQSYGLEQARPADNSVCSDDRYKDWNRLISSKEENDDRQKRHRVGHWCNSYKYWLYCLRRKFVFVSYCATNNYFYIIIKKLQKSIQYFQLVMQLWQNTVHKSLLQIRCHTSCRSKLEVAVSGSFSRSKSIQQLG